MLQVSASRLARKNNMTSTHTLNLLPSEDKKRIGRQRFTRFFIYVNVNIAIFLIIGIVLLLPTYFFLFFQNRGAQEFLAMQQQTTKTEQARELETRIQQTNATLERLQTKYNLAQYSLSESLANIVAKAPIGITLTFLSFEKETNHVALRGHALTRGDLLQFISIIREHPSFHDVESPVENILRDKNISFTLSFTVRNDKNL